jgi:hypothetical protein
VVLTFATGDVPPGLPQSTDVVGKSVMVEVKPDQTTLQRVVYEPMEKPFGADYTSLAPPSGSAIEIQTEFTAARCAGDTRLRVLALLQGKSVPDACGTLAVNGEEVPLQSIRSDSGFSATVAEVPEGWHFLEGTLSGAGARVSLRVSAQDPQATATIWVVADKPGDETVAFPDALPSPERISLDSFCVLPATELSSASESTRKTATVERIDGVFLDTLEPVHTKQSWGTLQKNRSVWEKEMSIGGKRFRRGLGTHANSEIVYSLDGRYRRFQAWAGPDMATYGTLGFAVVVDGQKRWESGKMTRGDAPQLVDVDIAGAKELRLLVDDAGNDIMGDHADWADAKLLR